MSEIHRYIRRVTYADCTLGNHVYYARYLNWLEEARGAFFRDLGHPMLALQETDTVFPVVECHLKFVHAAAYDDVVTVETRIAELERVRLAFSHRILAGADTVVLHATTVHACATRANRLKRIPEPLREALRPWLAEPGT